MYKRDNSLWATVGLCERSQSTCVTHSKRSFQPRWRSKRVPTASSWPVPHLPGPGNQSRSRARGVGVWAPAPLAPQLGRVPPEPPSRPRPSPTGAAPALTPSLGPQPGPTRANGALPGCPPCLRRAVCPAETWPMGLGGQGANREAKEELNLGNQGEVQAHF